MSHSSEEEEEDLIRDAAEVGLSATVLIIIGGVALVMVAIIGTWLWLAAEGPFYSKHTQNIRHSIGYVDAQNAHCESDIRDYTDAQAAAQRDKADPQVEAADNAHMAALVSDCRDTVAQLSPSEVAAPVAQFLAAHGG